MDGSKMIVFLIVINICVNFGVLSLTGASYKTNEDAIHLFANYNVDKGNVTINPTLKNQYPTTTSEGFNLGTTIIAIIDGLGMVFNVFLYIFSIIAVPVAIFGYLPGPMAILFCVPSVVVIALIFMSFIRGKDL